MTKSNGLVFLVLTAAIVLVSPSTRADTNGTNSAQPTDQSQAQPPSTGKPERMDVDAIRKKYWERGDDSDARVIQNRLYSKALKLEIGAYYGSISEDPFLSVRSAGTSLAFHLSESWAFGLLYWKDFVSASSAQASLQQITATQANPGGVSANVNPPKDYFGGELAYSPIYGKLSLFGLMIIHYDLHVLAGYGINQTDTGNDGAISFGIGQQFYLNKFLSLRVDYRAMHFDETINSSTGPFTRSNWTDVVTLGVTAFLGPL